MAASTRAITPTHSGPFSTIINSHTTLAPQADVVNSLAPLAAVASTLRASLSPPPLPQRPAMTPRVSPQPHPSDRFTPYTRIGATLTPADRALIAAKDVATKVSSPMAAIAKSIQIPEHGATTAGAASTSPTSISSLITEATTATTTTAPAVAPPPSSSENALGISGPDSGRALVDPGLPGVGDESPNRSFTFPPPLGDDLHTPSQRNLSLPNNVYGSGSPRPTSASKRHKCPYCATEFTRHHNLKSHLLTHSQEKPYECPQCQSRFRRLHDLKRHTKLHTGERPHICVNCGRKFARGDALARHCKGPGGCAGRRPSFIEEDPSGGRGGDDSMDGIEYTAEPEHMDDEDTNGDHRGAPEPGRMGNVRQDTYRPNTYPGVVPAGGLPSAYPANPPSSHDASISSQGPYPSIGHLGQQVFPQSSMTESPKPLSPGQTGDRSLPGPGRAVSNQYGSGVNSSPILPPPGGHQLPSLQNLPPPPPPPLSSHPGSLSSSHQSGSGNSMRDILGPAADVWAIIRDLEKRLNESRHERDALISQLRNDHARADQEHRAQIAALKEEVERLKEPLAPPPQMASTSGGAAKPPAESS